MKSGPLLICLLNRAVAFLKMSFPPVTYTYSATPLANIRMRFEDENGIIRTDCVNFSSFDDSRRFVVTTDVHGKEPEIIYLGGVRTSDGSCCYLVKFKGFEYVEIVPHKIFAENCKLKPAVLL